MNCALQNAVPLCSRPDFTSIFSLPLALDGEGLLRPVEMVGWPGMAIEVLGEEGEALAIRTPHYPKAPLYMPRQAPLIDTPVTPTMPSDIAARLEKAVGAKYIWGGNCLAGIPAMLGWFPPERPLTPTEKKIWTLEGVDCSGLIYEASGGVTPRNTAEMVTFGREVKELEPLDLLLWPGHVAIVLDGDRVIESRAKEGCVFISPLSEKKEYIARRFVDSF